MARARNIKPGFFKNEILGVADPLYSLLFEGLWVLADRGGKLEDRPLRIKGEVFPYRDGIDMEAMLEWLQSEGFIKRYSVAGKRYILVLEFVKHQNPHKNEAESVIPDPEEIGTKPEIIGTTRADSLSSDSGFLNPESIVPPPAAAEPKPSRKKPKTALPDDFTLTATGERLCVEAGFVVADELAKFKNHHAAAGSLMADWQAGFRTWIDKAKGFRKPWQVPPNVTTPTNPAAIYKPEPALTAEQLAANRANAAAQLEKLKRGGMAAIRQGAH